MLYVTLGSPEATRSFFADFDPDARAVADPDKVLYTAFGLQRGTAGQLMSTAVFSAGLRAILKGNGIGIPVGDVRQLSGEFLVRGGRIEWAFRAEDVSEHPSFEDVARAFASITR